MSIPNTLSIFINTRIRGSSKIKYSPGMSLGESSEKQVYFDPLIKLNYSVVNSIPKGLPETERFTQFFNKSQFNSLIQRTLGKSSQYRRNLLDATNQGVVDNNIRLTLDTLFHSGNPFYLNGKRFTIYSYEWEKGDWEVQSTKSEKMKKVLKPYTYEGYNNDYGNGYGYNYGRNSQNSSYYPPYSPNYPTFLPYQYQYNKGASFEFDEPVGIDPNALTGHVDPGLSKLERAAMGSGVETIAKKNKPVNLDINKLPQVSTNEIPDVKFPPPKNELCKQFLDYYSEGVNKGFIKNPLTPAYMATINQWSIENNKAIGDCFFEALRDSLNGYNEKAYSKNKIIVPPYYDSSTEKYSVPSLRKLVADYIRSAKGEEIYDNLVVVTQSEIDNLKNPFDRIPDHFIFMVDARNNILTRNEVAERISKTSTPSERPKGESPLKPKEYYWGDLIAASCCESVFQIKIVLISTNGIAGQGQNGSRVQFTDVHGNIVEGTIKNAQRIGKDASKFTADVETDDYKTYPNIPINQVRQIPRYSVYCHDTDTDLTNVDKFVFMLYSNDNHYESLYTEKTRDNKKYIFNSSDMPSYIKYMIFENCYRLLSPASRNVSSYGEVKMLSRYLRDMLVIYEAKIKNGPNALNTSNKRLLNGGSISGGQNLAKYNTGYDSNLTYYIVIDLELYPGDSIPLSSKATIACQIRYEKIRQSYADMFGLVYQAKELQLTEEMNKKYMAPKNKTKKEDKNRKEQNGGKFTRRARV